MNILKKNKTFNGDDVVVVVASIGFVAANCLLMQEVYKFYLK